MKGEVVGIGRGAQSYIFIDGLEELITFLKSADPKLKRGVQKSLKEAMSPVLTKARANASAIADDGTYSSSLSVASRRGGMSYVLKSTDPAAGVKEFARRGATYRPKSTDKRRNARKMRSFPVGVPRRANAPRVMVRAVEDSTDEILNRIDSALEQVLEER